MAGNEDTKSKIELLNAVNAVEQEILRLAKENYMSPDDVRQACVAVAEENRKLLNTLSRVAEIGLNVATLLLPVRPPGLEELSDYVTTREIFLAQVNHRLFELRHKT